MLKLYKKSELGFSLLWIGVYCVAMSVSDNISADIGIASVISLPVIVILSLILLGFTVKNRLTDKYGLCKADTPPSKMLFYIPLFVLLTVNLWYNVKLTLSPIEAVLYILTMLGVGFFEEILFRGLLFNAMLKDNRNAAIVVSSLTFGLGHIINLINGSGMNIFENIIQIVSAVAVGFMFVMIYIKSGSLILCIITHGLFNALSVFSDEALISPQKRIVSGGFIVILSVAYALYLAFRIKPEEKENSLE